jgi:hypothetical protein
MRNLRGSSRSPMMLVDPKKHQTTDEVGRVHSSTIDTMPVSSRRYGFTSLSLDGLGMEMDCGLTDWLAGWLTD